MCKGENEQGEDESLHEIGIVIFEIFFYKICILEYNYISLQRKKYFTYLQMAKFKYFPPKATLRQAIREIIIDPKVYFHTNQLFFETNLTFYTVECINLIP